MSKRKNSFLPTTDIKISMPKVEMTLGPKPNPLDRTKIKEEMHYVVKCLEAILLFNEDDEAEDTVAEVYRFYEMYKARYNRRFDK
jgi:hypothetical protein